MKMIQTISKRTHKARKRFRDDIYGEVLLWFKSGCYSPNCDYRATEEEMIIVDSYLLREYPHLIKPGEQYIAEFVNNDGTVYTFRMLAMIEPIVHKYKIGYED
jgi:hypothetical protein